MALVLTLLSVLLAYFSPEEVIPALAPYHIQQILILPAIAATLISMNMRRAGPPWPQGMLLMGFWAAGVMSDLSKLWTRAALATFLAIGLLICIYFLVYLNAFSLPRIHLFCGIITVCALIMAVQGILAYHTGYLGDQLLKVRMEGMVLDKRICGSGFLHDPNDFAQFLLVALSFLGLSWKKDNSLGSFIMLVAPAAVLVYAIYLTFSRGAVFGIAVVLFVAISKRIGKGASAAAAGLLFLFMIAMKFGGGREISLQENSAAGRIVAWGAGLAQLRHFPVFGAGYLQFTEYNDLTAHNSFVLCFAELGLLGYFFWMALILTTAWGLESLAKLPQKSPADAEFNRYVTTIRAALYGFLATSWFLSRTYTETLYIILALGAVLILMRRKAYPWLTTPARLWVPVTIGLQLVSILIVYATVRLRSL